MARKKNKYNGTLSRVKFGTAANALKMVADELSWEYTSTNNMLDTGSKDDGNDDTFILGSISRTLKCDAQLDLSTGEAKLALGDFMGWSDGGTELFWTGGPATVGDDILSGKCKVASFTLKNTRNEIASFSFEMRVSGAVALVTNA